MEELSSFDDAKTDVYWKDIDVAFDGKIEKKIENPEGNLACD